MQFIKTHWILLTCGLVSLAGIGGAAYTMTRTSVTERMNEITRAAGEIRTLRSNPQNADTIEAEKERGKRFDEEYNEVLETAERINRREPLLEGVFPRPPQLEDRYRFQEAYIRRLYELPDEVDGGTLPTEQEIDEERLIMEEEARRKAAEEGEAASSPLLNPPDDDRRQPRRPQSGGPPAGVPGAPPGAPPGGPPGAPPMGAPPGSPSPTPTRISSPDPKDAAYRASVRKAQRIRMYLDPVTSLHLSPIVEMQDPPVARDMWYAQVGLWIQQDILDAVRKLNDDAANDLVGEEPSVTNMPVKSIEKMHILGYLTEDGALVPFPAASGIRGAGRADNIRVEESFTGATSNAQFDVVRFSVTAIVDQRDLLQLIDYITRENFYQLIDVDFTIAPPSDDVGHFYGQEPIIRATLNFEGHMARRVYKPLMPSTVLQELGIGDESDDKGGSRRR